MLEQHNAVARRAHHGERIVDAADARHRRLYIERTKTAVDWNIVKCTGIAVKALKSVQRGNKNIARRILIYKPNVIAHKRQRIAVHMMNIPKIDTVIHVKPILRRHPHKTEVILEDIIDHTRRQRLARREYHLALRNCLRTYQT